MKRSLLLSLTLAFLTPSLSYSHPQNDSHTHQDAPITNTAPSQFDKLPQWARESLQLIATAGVTIGAITGVFYVGNKTGILPASLVKNLLDLFPLKTALATIGISGLCIGLSLPKIRWVFPEIVQISFLTYPALGTCMSSTIVTGLYGLIFAAHKIQQQLP